METDAEALWTESLPSQRQRLRAAFSVLSEKERRIAFARLQQMASKSGWADALKAQCPGRAGSSGPSPPMIGLRLSARARCSEGSLPRSSVPEKWATGLGRHPDQGPVWIGVGGLHSSKCIRPTGIPQGDVSLFPLIANDNRGADICASVITARLAGGAPPACSRGPSLQPGACGRKA
jgi:hypothetical protein